jgi:hypothetical protein
VSEDRDIEKIEQLWQVNAAVALAKWQGTG